MYFIGVVIALCVFAYYATWLDDYLDVDCMPVTCMGGVFASIFYPIVIAAAIVAVPLVLIARWGAKRRGEF